MQALIYMDYLYVLANGFQGLPEEVFIFGEIYIHQVKHLSGETRTGVRFCTFELELESRGTLHTFKSMHHIWLYGIRSVYFLIVWLKKNKPVTLQSK